MKNPLIKSQNFYVGFETSAKKPAGRIYLNSNHFANFYSLTEEWGKGLNGYIAFNREGMAIDMNCPVIGPSPSLEFLLEKLESFLKDGTIKIN